MPEFIVRVGTPDGAITERHVQAISVRAAEDELRQQGMHVFDARRGAMQLRDLLPRGKKIISTEHFLLFNQELLAQNLVREQLLFYTIEKTGNMWRFFDARTYRTGPFDQDYLIGLLEQLV